MASKPPGCLWRIVRTLFLLGVLLAACGAGAVWWAFAHFGSDLPDIRTVEDYRPPQVTRVYAADGEVIATWVDERAEFRTVLPFEEIPLVMRDAILAAEDASFYQHEGLDYVGLTRAVYTNLRRGELRQGASTITQQVVKNLVLSPERSIRRKIQEALLAFELERNLSKDQILQIYLNEIFFGVRYYGVEEAARYYFGHGAASLTLPEAAVLAGLVQSPNRYNPYRHPDRALARRAYVLRQMYEKGFINEAVYREADAAPLVLADRSAVDPWLGSAPWFVDAVRRELLEVYPAETLDAGGMAIHTTVRLPLQRLVEATLQDGLRAYDSRHGFHRPLTTVADETGHDAWRATNAQDVATTGLRADQTYRALIVHSDDAETRMAIGPVEVLLDRTPAARMRPGEDPWEAYFPVGAVFTVQPQRTVPPDALRGTDGTLPLVRLLPSAEAAIVLLDPRTREVLAIAGGFDHASSPFHRAVMAHRQTGSVFKAFIYAAALAQRTLSPGTVLQDQPNTVRLDAGRTWSPRNADGRFLGPMTVRTALARSRNVIAVTALQNLGVDQARAFATQLGLERNLPDNLTLALGSAETTPLGLTNAFATFADEGRMQAPRFVQRVEGPAGTTPWPAPADAVQVVEPPVAWLVSSMLQSVVERGTGTNARQVGHPAAGKTGTTNDARDAWFVGYTHHYVAGVWFGRDDNQSLGRNENGSRTALPTWTDLMTRLHAELPVTPFPDPPDGVVSARIDPVSGDLARPNTAGAYVEYFLPGTQPRTLAPDAASDRSVTDTLLLGGGVPDAIEDGATNDDGF